MEIKNVQKNFIFAFNGTLYHNSCFNSSSFFIHRCRKNYPSKAIEKEEYEKVVAMYVNGFFDGDELVEFNIENFGSAHLYNSLVEYKVDNQVKTDLALEIMFFPANENFDESSLDSLIIDFTDNSKFKKNYIVKEEDRIVENYLRFYDNLKFIPMTIYFSEIENIEEKVASKITFKLKDKEYSYENKLNLVKKEFFDSLNQYVEENKKLSTQIIENKKKYNEESDIERKAEIQKEFLAQQEKYNKNLDEIKQVAKNNSYIMSASLSELFLSFDFIFKVSLALVICIIGNILIVYFGSKTR